MKRVIYTLVISLFFFQINAESGQQAQPQQVDDAQVVLGNLATILVNFGAIVAAPQDPQTVAPGIAGMLGGLANIVAYIMKHMPVDRTTITPEDIEQFLLNADPQFKVQLRYVLLSLALPLHQKMGDKIGHKAESKPMGVCTCSNCSCACSRA